MSDSLSLSVFECQQSTVIATRSRSVNFRGEHFLSPSLLPRVCTPVTQSFYKSDNRASTFVRNDRWKGLAQAVVYTNMHIHCVCVCVCVCGRVCARACEFHTRARELESGSYLSIYIIIMYTTTRARRDASITSSSKIQFSRYMTSGAQCA